MICDQQDISKEKHITVCNMDVVRSSPDSVMATVTEEDGIASRSSSRHLEDGIASSSSSSHSNQHFVDSVEKQQTVSTVHLMPCTIEYDGNAPIKSFFHVNKVADGTLRSHFRGRELRGKILSLPSASVEGLCIGDTGNQQWKVEGEFSSIHVWEHDTLPDMAPLNDCVGWFALADAVHSNT